MASIGLRRATALTSAWMLASVAATGVAQERSTGIAGPIFEYQEVMIPMRDGIRLQTVILTPNFSSCAAADLVAPLALWCSRQSANRDSAGAGGACARRIYIRYPERARPF